MEVKEAAKQIGEAWGEKMQVSEVLDQHGTPLHFPRRYSRYLLAYTQGGPSMVDAGGGHFPVGDELTKEYLSIREIPFEAMIVTTGDLVELIADPGALALEKAELFVAIGEIATCRAVHGPSSAYELYKSKYQGKEW